jgi:hypothetical protein
VSSVIKAIAALTADLIARPLLYNRVARTIKKNSGALRSVAQAQTGGCWYGRITGLAL